MKRFRSPHGDDCSCERSACNSTATCRPTAARRFFPAPFEDSMPRSDQIAIVLFNLGGPEILAAVEPFLVNLFSDREIIELPGGALLQPVFARIIAKMRGPGVRANYTLIGGG